jgi:hypothetical protein
MNIVVGGAADAHLPRLPQLFTGRRQCRARGGRHRLEVPDLAFDSRVDADDAPRLVPMHGGSLTHVPDHGRHRPAAVGSDVERVHHVVHGRWSRDLRRKPVAAGQQIGQPLRNPLCDLVLVVGAADHRSHVVDEGLQAIRFHGDCRHRSRAATQPGTMPGVPRNLTPPPTKRTTERSRHRNRQPPAERTADRQEPTRPRRHARRPLRPGLQA